VGLGIIAPAPGAVHVAQQAGRIVALQVVASYTGLYIPARHLSMPAAAAAHPAGQGPPVGPAVPEGPDSRVHALLVHSLVVALSAKIADVQFVAGSAVTALAARFYAVEEAVVEAVAFQDHALGAFYLRGERSLPDAGSFVLATDRFGQFGQGSTFVALLAVRHCVTGLA